jgi:hypothetical protein
MRGGAGAEKHSNTISCALLTAQHNLKHNTAAPWEGGPRRCISTGSDERQQWRLVAEGGQVNGLHDLSNL